MRAALAAAPDRARQEVARDVLATFPNIPLRTFQLWVSEVPPPRAGSAPTTEPYSRLSKARPQSRKVTRAATAEKPESTAAIAESGGDRLSALLASQADAPDLLNDTGAVLEDLYRDTLALREWSLRRADSGLTISDPIAFAQSLVLRHKIVSTAVDLTERSLDAGKLRIFLGRILQAAEQTDPATGRMLAENLRQLTHFAPASKSRKCVAT